MKPRGTPDRESATSARMRLAMLLSGCTEERLRGFTAQQLAATHRVRLSEAEMALRQARQDRWHD